MPIRGLPPFYGNLHGPHATARAERVPVMPKHTRPAKQRTLPLDDSAIELARMVDAIEAEATRTDDPYWRRFNALMPHLIESNGSVDEAGDARHIRETSAGWILETAARQAGFVMGFEHCRRLQQLVGKQLAVKAGTR